MSHTHPRFAGFGLRENGLWLSDTTVGNATGAKHGLCPKIGSGLDVLDGVLVATALSDGDKGDISVSGSGATWTIDNDAVTYAKLQNVADARLLGRSAGSSGDCQEITVGSGLSLAAGNLSATGGGGSGSDFVYDARSSNTILGAADKGHVIVATAQYTQTITAAATLGNGWWCVIRNDTTNGTSVLTLDPNGSETVDGLTTTKLYSGEARLVLCDGSNFKTQLLRGGFARYTSDGSFIVPAGIKSATVDLIGAGGGGGGGRGGAASTVRQGGAGGGGGARHRIELLASVLGAAGDSISVTVPNGGAAGGGGSSGNGSPGTAGGTTTFGSLASAYGGGGGAGGSNSGSSQTGGGGGGNGEAGENGATGASAKGGGNHSLGTSNGTQGLGAAGASSPTSGGTPAHYAEWGGGGGGTSPGNASTAGYAGGQSVHGPGGGGTGGGVSSGNTEFAGQPGGSVGLNGGTGGAANGGAVNGGNGTVGADGDLRVCGQGGGGGGAQDSGTGGTGAAGGAEGGGGGGGGAGTTVGGPGGAGGRGECRVWYC